MRRVPKTLAAALIALLLALGVSACGGGDDSGSTETAAAGQQQSQADGASQDDNSGSENDAGNPDDAGSAEDQSGSDASDFVPKEHDDSGGGSEQFKVKGGDNSVQEFGEEAEGSDLSDAAAALHNFLDARAEGNWEAACQYLSDAMVESLGQLAERSPQIEDTSCATILEALTNPAAGQLLKEEAAKADVGSLRIEDERAFLIYTGTDGTPIAMAMANEDGEWKVASLAGTPLS